MSVKEYGTMIRFIRLSYLTKIKEIDNNMNVKELNNIMLLKRFREQVLFDRFETIDFETEIINRMKILSNADNTFLLNKWKEQLKHGVDSLKDFRGMILMRMSGFEQ